MSAAAAGPPALDGLLEPVRRALEAEHGLTSVRISAQDAQQRVFSSTWRVEIRAAQGDFRCILKWAPFGAARERELALLSREVFGGCEWVRKPRIACNPTAETFLVEAFPGRSLDRFGPWPPRWTPYLRRAGEWLQRFHTATANGSEVAGEGLVEYLRNRPRGLESLPAGLADGLLALAGAVPRHRAARVHGDFTPHNLLIGEDRIAVIDQAGIEEFDYGTPWFDVAAMMAGVERLWKARPYNALRSWTGPVDRSLAEFLESYGAKGNERGLRAARAVRYFTVLHTQATAGRRTEPLHSWAMSSLRSMVDG